jgi:hypothetical protein
MLKLRYAIDDIADWFLWITLVALFLWTAIPAGI